MVSVGWICGFDRMDLWIWKDGFVDLGGGICGFGRGDLRGSVNPLLQQNKMDLLQETSSDEICS